MLSSQASETSLAGIVDERTLSRLAHGLAQLLVPLGIGAQRHAGQELFLGRSELVLDDGHLVLGKRSAWRLAILVTPSDSTMVTTATRPSGMAATASETATIKVSSRAVGSVRTFPTP